MSQLGKYDEAQKSWDKSTPKNSDIFGRNKGRELMDSGNDYEALKSLDKQIEMHHYDAQAWNLKSIVLDDLGRQDESNKAVDRASWIWNNHLANIL